MSKVKIKFNRYCVLLAFSVISFLCVSHAWSGGLSWGPVAEEPSNASCVPEESPLLVKGALKSPMRIAEYREGTSLLSDRSGAIYEVNHLDPANPVLLFQIDGSPLGISFDGRNILVGNEMSGKIERYSLRRDRVRKKDFIPKLRSARIQPLDIAVDNVKGMTFVVDGVDGDVKVYNSRGGLTLSIGSFGQLNQPQALTLNPEAEEIIVTDYGDQGVGVSASLQVFDYAGHHLKSINGAFSRPQGVWAKGQSIYLVDAMLGQVMEFDRDTGSLLSTHGCFGASDGHLMLPMDVLYDSKLKQFYVADNRNGRISILPLIEQ